MSQVVSDSGKCSINCNLPSTKIIWAAHFAFGKWKWIHIKQNKILIYDNNLLWPKWRLRRDMEEEGENKRGKRKDKGRQQNTESIRNFWCSIWNSGPHFINEILLNDFYIENIFPHLHEIPVFFSRGATEMLKTESTRKSLEKYYTWREEILIWLHNTFTMT